MAYYTIMTELSNLKFGAEKEEGRPILPPFKKSMIC
jgi:hypothetical protein